MIQFLNINLWFYFSSMCKSFWFLLKNQAFFMKLCLFFVSILFVLNENELDQFFLMVSLICTLLVFVVTIGIACKEFTHFLFVNLTCYKFVFFILCFYFSFVTVSFAVLFLILQYNLDILFLDIIFLRFSFFEKTIFCYLIFIALIFFADSVRDKNNFSFSHFNQRFLEYLPPVFFSFLLFSLAFITFSTNFFIVYVLALFIFFYELKSFYQKTGILQIQNSSFVGHILRFSSGIPFFLFEIFFASEFALNGFIIGGLKYSHQTAPSGAKGASYASTMSRNFTENSKDSRLLKFMKIQAISAELRTPDMSEFLLESKKILVNNKILLPHQATINKNSGLEAHHLFILNQYASLKNYSLIPSVSAFMNEGFFILNPALTDINYFSQLQAFSAEHTTLVALVFLENQGQLLSEGDFEPLNENIKNCINDLISLKSTQGSIDCNEVRKFPSIYIKVEDILAINSKDLTQILRIQAKTEGTGLSGKTFIPKSSSTILVNKFAPTMGEALLLDNYKTHAFFKFSYDDPKLKKFCANLFEDNRKREAFLLQCDTKKIVIKNTIRSAIEDKLNNYAKI